MSVKTYLIGLVCIGLFTQITVAQDTVTVPDVVGLGVPEAAAVLNRSGLALGAEINVGWTADSGLPQNHVSSQSVASGETLTAGAAVDVTVLRSPNALLIYDDNDLTLVNQSGAPLDLRGILFNSVGGEAAYSAANWGDTLDDGDCGQVWSIGVREGKPHSECSSTQWRTTNNPANHFWTGVNGATQFIVSQNGVERAVCDVANPGRCEFYLASQGTGDDATAYIYFAYTPDRLIIRNTATDQWMPLSQAVIYSYNPNLPQPGLPLTLGDAGNFGNPQIVGDIGRLAPGQCLFFTNSSPTAIEPPQSCDVVATLNIIPDLIFWLADFEVASVVDGERRKCPAAQAGHLTICVMPR